ncbi:MAG TPA: AAA family ATPase [Thermoleophilaceae bacterium]
MLRVRLLGELSVEADGRELSPPPGRPGAVFAWLALHPGRHSRRELAGRFWPDVLDESARASLRTALHAVRAALGEAVVTTRDQVGLAPGAWVDVVAFRELLAGGDADAALALVRGELLEGLDDEWVYEERLRQRGLEAEALALVGRAAEQRGDLAAAIEATRRRVALDPLTEDTTRELMRLLARAGDRPAALTAFERLRERLRGDLGIAPAAETRRLAEDLRGGAADYPALPLPPALARSHRSPMVGRDAAMRALRDEWRAARDGARRLVLLAGDPGIGKTRLAGEFARAAFADGATVLYGRSQEEALTPYQPLAEALRPYLAACSREQIESQAGPLAPELARLVPSAAHGLPAEPATRDPGGARWRLFEAAAALLGAAARARPVLLVLDDLHWADRPTTMLIRHLAAHDPAPVVILGTYRDGELDPGGPLAELVAELRREGLMTRLALEPLAEREVGTLVTAWLGEGAPSGLPGAIASETAGNPFFVEEVLRHLRESGRRDVAELGIPEGVKDVLGQRLRRLGGDAGQLLAVAAVAGREFGVDVVERAGGLDRERVAAALDAALVAHVVREEPRRPGRYAFTHALVRDAIYDGLTPGRRALLHGEIGAALEELSAADPDPHLGELAHHYRHAAGAGAKAVDYSARAGRRAVSQLAYEDAARHYERALEIAAARQERCELLIGLGEARLRAGDVPGSRESFGAAAALARELGDAGSLARAALGRSGLGVTVLGHDPETVALLEEALAKLPQGERALRARLLGRLAIELYHASPDRRAELSGEAVALAREAGAPDALGDALSAHHVALWSPPHLERRLALADEMVALAESASDAERALQGRNWRVLDLLESGDLDAAEREIGEHGLLADELRLAGYQWWTPMWRAMLAILRGDFDDAARLGAEAVEMGRRAGDRVADLFHWIQTTYLDFERRPPPEAEPPDVPERMAVVAVQSALRSDLPLMHGEAGRIDEARAELDALAAGGFAAVANDMNRLASLAGLAQGVAVLDDAARAAELYELLAPYSERAVLIGRGAVCLGPAELFLGVLASACSRWEAAEAHFEAATAWAERAGARPAAAWAAAWRADMLARRGAPGDREAAAQAMAIARELGLGRLASRLRVAVG